MSDEPEREDEPGISMKEAIRQQHKKLTDSQVVFMPLPDYEEFLTVQYRVLDVKGELNKLSRRVAREFPDQVEGQLYSTMDAMALSCVEIFAVRQDEKPVPLSKAIGPDAPPVRYNKALAEFMGWDDLIENGTAREVILRLFADNEPAIIAHGIQLNNWMTHTTRQVNDNFLGNL